LQKNLKKLPNGAKAAAARVLENEKELMAQLRKILEIKITATKIRYHGDFNLEKVLFTGKDFVIIDFEGEPARAFSERRLMRSPLQDVAGMIRSFHYAVYSALLFSGAYRPEDVEKLEPWAELWSRAVSGVYLNAYLFEVEETSFVPKDRKEVEVLLRCFLMEKAVSGLGYELSNRPDWIVIPLRGMERLLKRT
jgi:maltose alpha-D-glucosyltransferase / alpha-amylase